MAASYPGSIKSFVTHVDYTESVVAAHPNDIQNEVVAIETVLGVLPAGASATVKSRIEAVETTANAALPAAGGTVTGNLAMSGNKVTGLGTPTDSSDAATKSYVDSSAAVAAGATTASLVTAMLFAGL